MRCKWCNSEAYCRQGHIWLCKKHYRFQQMRVTAKRHNKVPPSYEWLEQTWGEIGWHCPVCKRKVNWLSKEGTCTVITLQHDRNGKMRFLCFSCNMRHASFSDDSFYTADPNRKVCTICKKSLPLDMFATDRGAGVIQKKSWCRNCANKKHNEWRIKNRERENAKRRQYYHARIASGNPIPR